MLWIVVSALVLTGRAEDDLNLQRSKWSGGFGLDFGSEVGTQLGGDGELSNPIFGFRLALGCDLGPQTVVWLEVTARPWAVSAGPVLRVAPLGYDRSGPVLSARGAYITTGVWCPDEPSCPPTFEHPEVWGSGGVLAVGPAWRLTGEKGRHGFSIGLELEAMLLRTNVDDYSGFYVGGSGIQFFFGR